LQKIFQNYFSLFLTLILVLPGFAQDKFHYKPRYRNFISWETDKPSHIWHLPHRYILANSELITINGNILKRQKDYKINYLQGIVSFTRPVIKSDSSTIYYSFLASKFPTNYSIKRQNSEVASSRTKLMEITKSTNPNGYYNSDLQRSGTIFRGISVGSDQGMRLNSGLRLQISGKIAKNVDIVAALTDQSTPIQPEGNTKSLQEIDKIFIRLKSKHFKSTLGDYSVKIAGDGLGDYERKLQGIMADVTIGKNNLKLIAAASKGQFKSLNFMGQESNQGPYQLTGSAGQREIIVLAGTEKVYIDGELLIRGEDNDYIIEYGNGQIFFTRNRLITADSRITVDFQYSAQKYQKQIYGIFSETNLLNNKLSFNASFINESDDMKNPLDITITDEYRKILEKAGDSPDSAVASGGKYVGDNKGSYFRKDSLGQTIYKYAGINKGDYIVRFSFKGAGRGDYSFQGYGIYRYEGIGKGTYLPLIYLPIAKSHKLAAFSTCLAIADGIDLTGAFNLSSVDNNLFSSRNDNDNYGRSMLAGFHLNKKKLLLGSFNLGSLVMNASIKNIDKNYASLGRMSEIEHARKWGKQENIMTGEKSNEINLRYNPGKYFLIAAEAGNLLRNSGFKSRRKTYEVNIDYPKYPKFSYMEERIKTSKLTLTRGLRRRNVGNISLPISIFTTSISYKGEHQKDNFIDSSIVGFKYDEWKGSLLIKKGRFNLKLSQITRSQDKYNKGALSAESIAHTQQAILNFRIKKGFVSSLLYTHRNRKYSSENKPGRKSDLADMKIKFNSNNNIFQGNIHYSFSSSYAAQMVRDTITVGEGLGNYRYDEQLKELIPDQDGNLFVRNIQTGIFLPVNHLKFSNEIKFLGTRIIADKSNFLTDFIHSFETRTLLRFERRDKNRGFLKVNSSTFFPIWGQVNSTVSAMISFRQDFSYKPLNSIFSTRFRIKNAHSENYQQINAGIQRQSEEKELRLKAAPDDKIALEINLNSKSDQKKYTSRLRINRQIEAVAGAMELSYRPVQKIKLALNCSLIKARDKIPQPDITAVGIFVTPKISYSINKIGKLRSEIEIGNIRTNLSNQRLPYEMFKGDQPGMTFRWNMFFTYRLNSFVMATINYRGRKEAWRESVFHAGQFEVRAFF